MTTATKITLSRIAFIPVVVAVYLLNFPGHRMLAGVLFAIAALSDLIDGYVARKYNQVSDLGKFLDPIADKMLVVVFMFLFVADNLIFNPWGAIVCGVVLSREFMISAFRMQAAVKKSSYRRTSGANLKPIFRTSARQLSSLRRIRFSCRTATERQWSARC